MRRLARVAALLAAGCLTLRAAGGDALIVADEMPQMDALSRILSAAGVQNRTVRQPDMPERLSGYGSVIVFLHGALAAPSEKRFIEYTKAGGRLILLHHSINSLRRKNEFWLDFLGVRLPEGDRSQGGYWFTSPVAYTLVNLDPEHYITTHDVRYDGKVEYRSSEGGGPERRYDAFTLKDTEVYLNHEFSDSAGRRVLLGVKFEDPKTGKVYMQDRGGWIKRSGEGWILYFMPGHAVPDIENRTYSQILVNAVKASLE